jgi:ABC-type polysaccharide/polyol phosphate transport system ATPase subunit
MTTAMVIEGLSVAFTLPGTGPLRRRGRKVQALTDVSFEVARGETFGIIGRNGAGKSTLLRVLARTLNPDRGRVEIDGKVSTLLSLGSGFNPELSGRRNIVLGCLAAGLSRQRAKALVGSIVDYAELSDSIDRPLKTYSSGMSARLAFSISLALDPEILLVDEVFSVGDLAFRDKSARSMNELISRAGSLVIVSHQLRTLSSICSRVMWLNKGHVAALGDPDEVIEAYQNAVRLGET